MSMSIVCLYQGVVHINLEPWLCLLAFCGLIRLLWRFEASLLPSSKASGRFSTAISVVASGGIAGGFTLRLPLPV